MLTRRIIRLYNGKRAKKSILRGGNIEQKADTVFNGLYDGKENKLQHAGASDRD